MRWISNKTVNICGILSSLEEAFEFCWSSLTDEHNTLPKSTRRNVKLDKFSFVTPWLPDLLCKHWFTSSVWIFCRWVADVPPRETSFSGDERGGTSAVRRLQNRKSCQRTAHYMADLSTSHRTPSALFFFLPSLRTTQKGTLASTTATATKTSLLKWFLVVSIFVAFIPICWSWFLEDRTKV